MDERARRITAELNLSGTGIEYGPLHRPLVPKSIYPDARYVDFETREYLVKKYAEDPQVDTNLIPEIDVVTGGKPISQFLPPHSIDYVVASHVMEHVPDFIGWLEENLVILKPGGRIAVAFPDRRYCFDLKKARTMFSDLVAAWLEKRTQPTFQQQCDQALNSTVPISAEAVWRGETTPENAKLHVERAHGISILKKRSRTAYIDCHCWKLSDEECLEILTELKHTIPLPYEIVAFSNTRRNDSEFHFTLERI